MLIHVCCGGCLIPFAGLPVVGVFYNPNIHPLEEYRRRRDAAFFAAHKLKIEISEEPSTPLEWIEKITNPHKPFRCFSCLRMRMEKIATMAKQKNFEFFSTTLLSSPFSRHEEIKQFGKDLEKETGVKFFYEDFRKKYAESIKISKQMSLYRQNYCGCFLSSWERAGVEI